MRIHTALAASLIALSLTGCGGGGGPSEGSLSAGAPSGLTPPPSVTVTQKKDCSGNVQNEALEAALISGDASALTDETVILKDILGTTECHRTNFNSAKSKLFNLEADGAVRADSLTAISWNPTHDSALLAPIFGQSDTVLVSNATFSTSNRVENAGLAVIGTTGDTRHMAMGGHPLRNAHWNGASVNGQMQSFMENSLSWLTKRDDLKTAPFKVVIAQMGQDYYFPDQVATRNWLSAHYGTTASYNAKEECNGAALSTCLAAGTDLLIISQWTNNTDDIDVITQGVKSAIGSGIPVLYMHYDGGLTPLGAKLLPLLKTTYQGDNYWPRQSLENYNGASNFGQLPQDVIAIKDLITRLQDNNFSIDLSLCDDNSCPETSNYQTEFANSVSLVKNKVDKLDQSGKDLFDYDERRFDKGLVLLADHYRQKVTYPMDKVTSPRLDFLKSLYADSVVHVARKKNAAQADMGNFSRSNFSHITPLTRDVTLTARPIYRAAGVYALPGQTVTVTRTDSSAVNTHIKVNMIRPGATHLFSENAYNRPKYLTSQDLPIAAGQTITFTSPYGGPIQVRFDAKDVDVNFTFQNVGEHPVWRGAADDAAFADKLNAGEYDWAELITPSFEVHSKLEKMRETVNGKVWPGAAAIGAATEEHLHNYPHILAGYKGVGIDVINEIHDFASVNGLEIHTLDSVKHMNADQAACGYGCSGNPYDAYWSFSPLGHGDIHELGHGLERSRFRYSQQEGHTSTNPYSYYSKSKYYEASQDEANLGCQSLPYESLFNIVQKSRNETDPKQYMKDQNLIAWNQGVAINIQIMMAAQDLGLLSDGWHLLARQHIIEREFNIAIGSEASWSAKKDGLGFGSFSRDAARALSNNDWNLIALSHALGRDLTPYLEMWGFDLTDAAKAHVGAWNYQALPLNFYTAEPQAHCKGFTKNKLPVDGMQTWPVANTPARGKSLVKVTAQQAADHVCTYDEPAH